MNFLKPSVLLLNFVIAIMLVMCLWMSSVQNLQAPNALGNGDIELTINADSNSDNTVDQMMLLSLTSCVCYTAFKVIYSQLGAQRISLNYFPPPDRPPAKSV
jgi:hypothetical protein